MTDNETIAAILAAGMLPPLAAPGNDPGTSPDEDDRERLLNAVLHAVGVYRSILDGLAARSHLPNGAERAASGHRPALRAGGWPMPQPPQRARGHVPVEPVTPSDWDWA
jgi:hypothetical protein